MVFQFIFASQSTKLFGVFINDAFDLFLQPTRGFLPVCVNNW